MNTTELLIHFTAPLLMLGCGLIGGVFFAFSSFVMKALVRLAPAQGIAAMQSINVVVLNPWFLGVFLGTAVACALVMILSLLQWQPASSAWLVAGAVLYLVGTLVVTMLANVPRNEVLAVLDPNAAGSVKLWAQYVSQWTFWNHVRTAASLAASLAFCFALA